MELVTKKYGVACSKAELSSNWLRNLNARREVARARSMGETLGTKEQVPSLSVRSPQVPRRMAQKRQVLLAVCITDSGARISFQGLDNGRIGHDEDAYP